jgi:hypothetical protein
MKSLDEIKEDIRKHNEFLVQKYGVRVVGIFGSTVRGERKRRSDIDLLAQTERPVSLLKLIGAELYLRKVLRTKVDLVTKEEIRKELKERILQETVYL